MDMARLYSVMAVRRQIATTRTTQALEKWKVQGRAFVTVPRMKLDLEDESDAIEMGKYRKSDSKESRRNMELAHRANEKANQIRNRNEAVSPSKYELDHEDESDAIEIAKKKLSVEYERDKDAYFRGLANLQAEKMKQRHQG